MSGLGQVFEGENLSFKPWPSCRGTHPFVEAALTLRARHAFQPFEIEHVRASVSDMFKMLCEPFAQKCSPATANDAKFSVPFTTAAALVHGRLGLSEFLPSALRDEEVTSLAQRVRCQVRPPAQDDALRGTLTVVLRNGRQWEEAVDRPLGDPSRPLNDFALQAKFTDCASHAAVPLGQEQAQHLARAITALDSADDLSALLA